MELHDIKLIKYGIIFFYDHAILKYNPSIIEITKQNGEVVFRHHPSEIKKVIFNSSSGIFTIKTQNGQRVNISFKGDFTWKEFGPVNKFRAYLRGQGIKGYKISYGSFGKLKFFIFPIELYAHRLAAAKHRQQNTKHLIRDVFWYHYYMNDQDLKDYIPDLRHIWDALVRQDTIPERVDAIVVGGCKDLGLAERTAELFHAGVSNLIIVSGYKQEGMEITEAELLANKCMDLGVPTSTIQLEKNASNTGENIIFSAKLAKDLVPNLKSVVLMHKPFMSLRFLATAEAQWPAPQPKFYTTCQSISFEDYTTEKGLEAVGWEMLGDFNRMDEYVTKGFQTQKQIPNTARDAYDRIVSAGFATR